jgi:plastocyanin
MTLDVDGVVMNENHDQLPRDCTGISREHAFTIHAGKTYAQDVPGMVFGMSEHEVRVMPCSRVKITFVNEDAVRHQWMVHGLPKYLYPAGMFHIEVSGGHRKTGTFIVPGDDRTYLIHCDMAQHMEKGMRGQLVVGAGSGNLWGVAGISDQFYRSAYLPQHALLLALLVMVASFLLTISLSKKN